MCNDCKYYFYDNITGASDCTKLGILTEQEYNKYYMEDQEGCPYKEIDNK